MLSALNIPLIVIYEEQEREEEDGGNTSVCVATVG